MMFEITRGLAPTLDRVTEMGALVVFTPCLPKFGITGVAEAAGVVTPVPVSVTVRGLLGSSVVMTIVPVLFPAAVGVKVTFNRQLVDDAIGNPVQVLEVRAKSPVVSMSEIVRAVAPALDRVMVIGVLVELTPCFPKASEVGAIKAAEVVTPVPVNEMTIGLAGSFV